RRDDARARTRPWRAPGAGGAAGRAYGAHAAYLGRNGERVRRDADLPGLARQCGRARAQGDARTEGRGHAQYGSAADRVLLVRAQAAYRAAQRRTDGRPDW